MKLRDLLEGNKLSFDSKLTPKQRKTVNIILKKPMARNFRMDDKGVVYAIWGPSYDVTKVSIEKDGTFYAYGD